MEGSGFSVRMNRERAGSCSARTLWPAKHNTLMPTPQSHAHVHRTRDYKLRDGVVARPEFGGFGVRYGVLGPG